MEDFTINMPTQILFGVSALEKLASQLNSDRVGKVLLLFGGNSAKRFGNLEEVESALRQHQIAYTELGGQSAPTWQQVQAGIALVKKHALQAVIGVGGSSVMDMAKMIGFGTMHDDLWSYLRDEKSPVGLPTLPIITVPTYPSGGSEADYAAEVDDLETGEHGSLYGVYPQYAALDPSLTMSLDDYHTNLGAMVIFIQASLSLLGTGNPIATGLSKSVIETLLESLRTLKVQANDYQARANIMWSSALTTQPMMTAGTDGESAMQFYEDEDLIQQWLGLSYRDALTLIFPHWLEMMAAEHQKAVARYFQVIGLVDATTAQSMTVDHGIMALMDLFADFGLPTKYGKPIEKAQFEALSQVLEVVDAAQRPAYQHMLIRCVEY